jgi:hypothetical protein
MDGRLSRREGGRWRDVKNIDEIGFVRGLLILALTLLPQE